jgi:phytoene dehydrogenase-like protein
MGTKRAIVVGTGAGGLAAAGYLAKNGFDVTGVEQSSRLGGYLCPFTRGAFAFDVGAHYFGECRPGQLLHDTLTGLGIVPETLFCELDPDGFDVYRFPDFEIRMCRGLERYGDRVVQAFPSEERGLRRMFELTQRLLDAERAVRGAPKLRFEYLATLSKALPLVPWVHRTFGDLLDAHVKDPRARAVVAAASGDYALPPSQASMLVGLNILGHYSDGAFYPRGGSGALRDALVRAAERHGARFRTGARVARILTRDRRAVGVEIEGGERLDADVVVSNADPVLTFTRLVDPETLPPAFTRRVRASRPSLATFALYYGMKRDLSARIGPRDVWDYGDWDIEAAYSPIFHGVLPDNPVIFLSPSSLKDDTGTLGESGCSTLEVVTFVPYSLFMPWRHLAPGERGADHEREKLRVADWLERAVETRWPGLIGDVVVREISTPLTNESYVLAVEGGAYGPAQTPDCYGPWRFQTQTPVRNLFLAGAGVIGGGVTPSLFSGRRAAELAAS